MEGVPTAQTKRDTEKSFPFLSVGERRDKYARIHIGIAHWFACVAYISTIGGCVSGG